MQPSVPAATAEQVADLLAAVAHANGRIAAATDRISNTRSTVSLVTNDPLTGLTDDARSGARARAQLAAIPPDLLLAGTAVWLTRRRNGHARGALSATDRAAARWGQASA